MEMENNLKTMTLAFDRKEFNAKSPIVMNENTFKMKDAHQPSSKPINFKNRENETNSINGNISAVNFVEDTSMLNTAQHLMASPNANNRLRFISPQNMESNNTFYTQVFKHKAKKLMVNKNVISIESNVSDLHARFEDLDNNLLQQMLRDLPNYTPNSLQMISPVESQQRRSLAIIEKADKSIIEEEEKLNEMEFETLDLTTTISTVKPITSISEIQEITEWLKQMNYEQYAHALRDIGCDSWRDLNRFTAEKLQHLANVKPIHAEIIIDKLKLRYNFPEILLRSISSVMADMRIIIEHINDDKHFEIETKYNFDSLSQIIRISSDSNLGRDGLLNELKVLQNTVTNYEQLRKQNMNVHERNGEEKLVKGELESDLLENYHQRHSYSEEEKKYLEILAKKGFQTRKQCRLLKINFCKRFPSSKRTVGDLKNKLFQMHQKIENVKIEKVHQKRFNCRYASEENDWLWVSYGTTPVILLDFNTIADEFNAEFDSHRTCRGIEQHLQIIKNRKLKILKRRKKKNTKFIKEKSKSVSILILNGEGNGNIVFNDNLDMCENENRKRSHSAIENSALNVNDNSNNIQGNSVSPSVPLDLPNLAEFTNELPLKKRKKNGE